MQRFIIRWRVWLTHRLTGDWLDGDAYYRGRFIDNPIDNADQRIQQDIDIFTTGTGDRKRTPRPSEPPKRSCSARSSIVNVVSFTPILWRLAGPLTIFGVTVPKALFWMALVYVFFTTVVAFWIGHPLIRLSFRNELTNAAFRYALVRLRDAGEAVGFYRGEGAERGQLMTRFAAIIANYRAFVRRSVAFLGWNRSVTQIVDPLPTIVQAPRLFAGQIQLGDITQSSSAFLQVHGSLAFFRAVYDSFASYRAAIIRLDGLITANETARELPVLTALPSTDGSVELDDVEVRTPAGVRLVDPLDMRLDPGESLVITGNSGSGKTTLLRSLAQLWPFTSGTLRSPHDDTMFLSQLPYVPLGDLRAAVCYPSEEGAFSDDAIRSALDTVSLAHLQAASTKCRTGPRCSPPASSRGSRSRVCCWPSPRRCFSTSPPRHWTRVRSSRCTGLCAPRCRTALWSASATAALSNSTTTGAWNCSAAANGASPRIEGPA